MADKKVLGGFSPSQQYVLSEVTREFLNYEFSVVFTDEDFNEMESLLEDVHGEWEGLQAAPPTTKTVARLDKISESACGLSGMLYPSADDEAVEDNAIAQEAADRVKALFYLSDEATVDDDQANIDDFIDNLAVDQLNAFQVVLARIPELAAQAKTMVSNATMKERGSGHLPRLLLGLEPICQRRSLQTGYSYKDREPERTSDICSLGFQIGKLLPRAARPVSEAALVKLWVGMRKKER